MKYALFLTPISVLIGVQLAFGEPQVPIGESLKTLLLCVFVAAPATYFCLWALALPFRSASGANVNPNLRAMPPTPSQRRSVWGWRVFQAAIVGGCLYVDYLISVETKEPPHVGLIFAFGCLLAWLLTMFFVGLGDLIRTARAGGEWWRFSPQPSPATKPPPSAAPAAGPQLEILDPLPTGSDVPPLADVVALRMAEAGHVLTPEHRAELERSEVELEVEMAAILGRRPVKVVHQPKAAPEPETLKEILGRALVRHHRQEAERIAAEVDEERDRRLGRV